MALVRFRFWQNCRVPYNGAVGAGVDNTGIPSAGTGQLFDHGAVCVTLDKGPLARVSQWFTTQLPIYVPYLLNLTAFNGQLNLPSTGTIGTAVTRVTSRIDDTVGQEIINGLTSWNITNALNTGGNNGSLASAEVNNCFSMIYWAGIHSKKITSAGNHTHDLCPFWMLIEPELKAYATRVGTRTPSDPTAVSVNVGSLGSVNMEIIRPFTRGTPMLSTMVPYTYKRCNIAVLNNKITT